MSGDKFAFVGEPNCVNAATTATVKAMSPTSVSSTGAVVSWSATDAPKDTGSNKLLALCWYSSATEGGWRYFGTYKGMNYRVVKLDSISNTRFWNLGGVSSAVNKGPANSFTGAGLFSNDRLSYTPLSGTVTTACSSFSTTTPGDNVQPITAAASFASATMATDLRFSSADYTKVVTMAICWNNGLNSVFLDTGVRVQVTAMTLRNAIYAVFPSIIQVNTGAVTLATTSIRIAGWNINANDVLTLSAFGGCAGSSTAVAPASGDNPLGALTAETTTGYNTFTVSTTGFAWNTKWNTNNPTTVTAATSIYLCYYAAGYIAGQNQVAAKSIALTTSGATYFAQPDQSTFKFQMMDVANCDNNAQWTPEFIANDWPIELAVFPKGKAVSTFVRGCLKNNDKAGLEGTCATIANYATIADATWPQVAITATVNTVKACVGRATPSVYFTSAANIETYDAAFAAGGAGSNYAEPTQAANSLKWFMAGWTFPTSGNNILLTPAPGTLAIQQFGFTAEATPTDTTCVTRMIAYPLHNGAGSSAVGNSVGTSNLRNIFELDASLQIGSQYTTDVSKDTVLTMCVRLNNAGTKTSTWMPTTVKITQLPKIDFYPAQALVLTTGQTSPTIYVTGAASTDKFQLANGAPTTGADYSCTGANAPTFTGPASGYGVGSFSQGFSSTGISALNSAAAHGVCIIRAGDTRALYITAAGGQTVTTTAANGGVNGAAVYAGQTFTLSVNSNLNLISTDLGKVVVTNSDCTSGAISSAPITATFSYTATYLVGENGIPYASGSWSSVTGQSIASSSTTNPTGNGSNICKSASLTGTGLGSVRVASLAGSCTRTTGASFVFAAGSSNTPGTLGCAGSGVVPGDGGKAIKIPGFGNYYVNGFVAANAGTGIYALFDAWGLQTGDKIAFLSKSYTPATAMTSGGQTIITQTLSGNQATVTTYGVSLTSASIWYESATALGGIDSTSGGVYNAWVQVGSSAFVNSGFTVLVVKFNDRYPGSSFAADGAATVYVSHGGLDTDTGDFFGQVGGSCVVASIPTQSATATGVAKMTFSNGYGILALPVLGSTGTPAAGVIDRICYRPSGQASDANFQLLTTQTFAYLAAGAGNTASIVSSPLDTNKFYVFEGKSATLTLNQAAGGTGTQTINDGYFKPGVVNSADADCTNYAATTQGTATAAARNLATYSGSDVVITAPTLTSIAATNAAGTASLCYTPKKTVTAATDFVKLANLLIQIKPAPIAINSATANTAIINNARTSSPDSQIIEFTVSVGTSTAKLDAADSACLVLSGSAAPTSAAMDGTTTTYKINQYTPSGATSAINAYCVRVTTQTTVDFKALVAGGVGTLPTGVYDLYINAGSGAIAASRSTPIKVTGTVASVAPVVRPSVVISNTGSTDTRTLYMDSASVGNGRVAIGTACPAAGSTTGSLPAAASVAFNIASGATKICFQSSRDNTAAGSRVFFELQQALVVNSALTTSNLAVAGTYTPAGYTNQIVLKVHANTPTPLNFPHATSAAQQTDIFRVLTYAATSKTPAATCANAVAADVEKDTTMVGEFSPANIGATSSVHSGTTPLLLNAQTSYFAASGQRELTACWSQQSTKPSVFEGFPTNALLIRVVDVATFVIGSATAQPLSNTMPRTMFSQYQDTVFFQGRWLEQDDFASFVKSSNTDCSRAFLYENAIVTNVGSTVVAGTAPAAGDNNKNTFSTTFESGIYWGGLYSLCYFAGSTSTGYRLYNAATDAKLRVIDATVSPRFASANTPITYTLSLSNNVGLTAPETTFTNMDRASFTAGASATCATLAGTTGNLPVNLTASADGSSATFTANLTASGTAASAWDPCVDAVLASGWNTPGSPNAIGPAGNIANAKSGATVSTTAANAISPFHVIVWAIPRFQQVTPVTVPVGRPTDVALWGSLLSATGDSVNVTMDATCTNSTVPAAGSGLSANPAALGGNSVLVRGWVAATKGTWNICYKPAGQGASGTTQDASGLGAHGATITAVVVDSVTPTGAAAVGNTVITLNGVFNFQANIIGDKHYVGLIPRDISGAVRDCAGLNGTNVVEATQVGTTSTGITLSLSSTLTPTANTEYAFCVHFAGMAWSTPADSAKDYVLVNPVAVSYSVRGVTDVQPRSIVNGTAQTLRFFGAGIRDFDSVTLVPATGNGNAPVDCAAAAASAVQVQNRAVTSTWAANAAYRVCYGFNISGAITWTFAGGNATTIASQAFQLTRLVAPAAVAPATTINADAGISTRVVVQGTGLSGLDTARLVNITSLTAAGVTASVCDLTSTAGGTPYYRVLPDPTTPGNWWFDVPAGDAASGSSFGICYRSGSLPGTPAPTFIASTSAFTIAFATAPRVQGYGPQAIPARVASVNFVFFGMALVGTDGVSIAAGAPTATSCAAPVSTTVVAVSPTTIAGRSIANATLAIPGTNAAGVFTLCYHYKNQGAGVAQAFTILPSAAACTAGQRYLCAGGCQATPCAFVGGPSTGCNGNPSAVRCPASNICVRTLADCLAFADQLVSRGVLPAPAAGQIRCFDGSLASNVAFCAPVDAPPAGYARCEDGSFSAAGACLDAKGAKIVNTCATQTPKATFCPNSGGCAASADFCPPADGCPAGKLRCSDCSCRDVCTFTGGPQGLPFQCADGTWRANEGDCKCHRFLLRGLVRVLMNTTVRRRFVVRASAALTVTLPGPANAPNVLVVDLPVNVGVTDNCQLVIGSPAESQVDAVTTGTSYIASPMPVLSFVSGNSSTTPCVLLPTANITVSFPTVEAIGSNATLTCALPWGGNFMGSNVTVSTLPAVAPATIPRCSLSGAAIMSTPIALATGAITPKAPPTGPAPSIVPSVAPVPSVPPTNSSTAPVPSSGASTAPAPSGTASPSVAVTASSAIIAFVVAVLALLI